VADDYAQQVEQQLDAEIGSAFDWLSFPTELLVEKDKVTDYPDRGFVRDCLEMLDRDGEAMGVLNALTLPLRQANLTLVKPDQDLGQTERVRQELFSSAEDGGMETSLDVVIAQMVFAAAVRRSYHERVWTRRSDGFIGYKKAAWRPPASCELVRDRQSGDLQGFKQFLDWERKDVKADWQGFITIPSERALVHINGQHRDPLYGTSDLAVTMWAYTMKQKVLRLWFRFLDRVSIPKTVAYGTSPTEATENAQRLAGLGTSGVVGMVRSDPSLKPFDVLDSAGQGADQFLACIRYLDSCMTRSVLAGFLDLTSSAASGKGSFALSSDQSGLFLASRHAAAKEVAATLNRYLIAPLVRVNYGPAARVPQLVFEKISQDQTDKALAMLTALGTSPNIQVPTGFVNLLVERVGQYLDLPDDRVEKILSEAADQARQQLAVAGQPQPRQGSPAGNLNDAVNGALAVTEPQAA
jgi:Protein of unknown function (DUF935)